MRLWILCGVVGIMACASDGQDGANGLPGPAGSTGPQGPPGSPAPKGTTVVWRDAAGKTIPVMATQLPVIDTQGFAVLYYADAQGLVWQFDTRGGRAYAAGYVTPVFTTNDCTGAAYVRAMSRWTYAVRNPKDSKVIYFKDDAKLVDVAVKSVISDVGTCVASNDQDKYLAVADAVVVPTNDVPSTGVFTIPVHPELAP